MSHGPSEMQLTIWQEVKNRKKMTTTQIIRFYNEKRLERGLIELSKESMHPTRMLNWSNEWGVQRMLRSMERMGMLESNGKGVPHHPIIWTPGDNPHSAPNRKWWETLHKLNLEFQKDREAKRQADIDAASDKLLAKSQR